MKFQFHNPHPIRWPYRRLKNTAELFIEKAKTYGKVGDDGKLLTCLNWASRLAPTNLDYLWVIANFWYHQDLDANAVPALSRIIKLAILSEDLEKAYNRRAYSYELLGQHMDSLTDMDWLINNGFGDAFRFERRGECRLKMGDFQGAIDDFSEVIRLYPKDETTLWRRAEAYTLAQRFTEALQDLTTYYEQFGLGYQKEWLYVMRGRVYYHLGRHEEALADFRKVTGVSRPLDTARDYMKKFFRQDVG
ncbi:MAG: tetratricopeptide repeat protein [Anaerolineae bacterium]|nr:MAG: tetratricopeptide repeat protein [Anaerolineae bacterium]